MPSPSIVQPHGVPVLFAPGNAGSYRQVRSLAAAAARQYYESPGQPRQELHDAGLRELDFFAGVCSYPLDHGSSIDIIAAQPTSTKISPPFTQPPYPSKPNTWRTALATS